MMSDHTADDSYLDAAPESSMISLMLKGFGAFGEDPVSAEREDSSS